MSPGRAKSTVYLARHGETPWNLEGRWQGQTDIPLHEEGRRQARALVERLRRCEIALVHTSDLLRARETAEIVAAALDRGPVTVDADLRERRFGVFEGLTRHDCETTLGDVWARYLSDRRCLPPGAEPEPEVIARMRRAIERVIDRLAATAGAAALVVSHGSALRSLLGDLTGRAIAPVGNGAVFRLDVCGPALGDCVLTE